MIKRGDISRLFGIFVVLIWVGLASSLLAQRKNTLDTGMLDAGNVRLVISNLGQLGYSEFLSSEDILTPKVGPVEFPKGSGVGHIRGGGLFIAAVTFEGDTLLARGTKYMSPGVSEFTGYSSNPADSVFRFTRKSPGPPFNPPTFYKYQQYKRFSDEDLLTRYREAGKFSGYDVPAERSLYNTVYQFGYSWGYKPEYDYFHPLKRQKKDSLSQFSHPLEYVIVIKYRIIHRYKPLDAVYVGQVLAPAIGKRDTETNPSSDDRIIYNDKLNQVITVDTTIANQEHGSAIGTQFFPPKKNSVQYLFRSWQWENHRISSSDDTVFHKRLSRGRIMKSPPDSVNKPVYFNSSGPYKLEAGKDLWLEYALVFGKNAKQVRRRGRRVRKLQRQQFQLPQPPPSPQVTVTRKNHKAIVEWEDKAQTFKGEFRLDNAQEPVEGYRVYKQTGAIPKRPNWKLIAQFDRSGNDIGKNNGIKYRFVDKGVAPLQQYQYAVTAFTAPDTVLGYPGMESRIRTKNKQILRAGSNAARSVDSVAVVPNPYRKAAFNESQLKNWLSSKKMIRFVNLPQQSVIKIYTLSGRHVRTIQHFSAAYTYENWSLTNSRGDKVSSGIYLYTVKNKETGAAKTDKFVIIK